MYIYRERERERERERVLRDSQRNWINGFSMRIGFVTNNTAELWAVRPGLLISCELDYKFINLQIDYEIVICWLTSNETMTSGLWL